MYNIRKIMMLMIVLLVLISLPIFSQESTQIAPEKKSVFEVTPAASFVWYPYSKTTVGESTITEIDTYNFGISVLLGLKLFDKIGAQLNLTIDDPTFEKMVDFAGYINAFNLMLKFDFHAFGGNVTWQGETPDPIPNNKYNFRNTWNTVSLMYSLDELLYPLRHMRLAIGISFVDFSMPVEYQIRNEAKFPEDPSPGFGKINGQLWGISLFTDTLVKNMDLPSSDRNSWISLGWLLNIDALDNIKFWIYTDFNLGFLGTGELDKDAINWMKTANNVNSIDTNFDVVSVLFMKYSQIVGFQYIWDIGKKSRIGLAIGADMMLEMILAGTEDIEIDVSTFNIGPAVRLSIKF
jgi:hypothetical protein